MIASGVIWILGAYLLVWSIIAYRAYISKVNRPEDGDHIGDLIKADRQMKATHLLLGTLGALTMLVTTTIILTLYAVGEG